MDGLYSGMESLSMRAAEWKQPAAAASIAVSASDLNPEAVKEFIPGQGWSACAAVADSYTGEEESPNKYGVFGMFASFYRMFEYIPHPYAC